MKTIDETQQRRTLNLLMPQVPAGQQVMFDHDPLNPELDNPLPPARDDTKPTAAPTATPCAVCAVGRVATMAPARLCPACLSDLEITRAHVEGVLISAMAHVERQADAWQQALCAVDEATLARFRKAERLLETGTARTTKGFVETWHNETQARTPLGVVLLAYEAYQTALQALKEQRDWAVRAMREIEAAG